MANIRREILNNFNLPERINRLGELAYNLWWVWNPEVQKLYQMINKPIWESVRHCPVEFLQKVGRPYFNAAVDNKNYLGLYDQVMEDFDQHLKLEDTWYSRNYPNNEDQQIAYFSFEFGLHESLPVYAGGLGVLSGDHLKESSDLGLPLVAVGFIYRQGYFAQSITEDGWQETRNYHLNFKEMPIISLFNEDGEPLSISVSFPDREVIARIWEVKVGRVSLFLLDSDVEENSLSDRQLTARLYSNDPEVRISQELLLGVGGVRALRLLGHNPTVWHMNEGHSAFLSIERIRELVTGGLNFDQAVEQVRKTNVFTTHTPVPAGSDQFPLWTVEKYFSQIWPELGLSRDEFIDLARHVQPWGVTFSMPVLALRLSEQRNAVSELHENVSRHMWHFLWPDRSEEDVPITHITNGVHNGTWLARRMRGLFDKYLGADWMDHLDEPAMWAEVKNIPDAELWAVRQHLKRKLGLFILNRARQQWLTGNVHPIQVLASGIMLDPYVLTIGFARRFATYKRAYLILRNYDRLLKIFNSSEMPVQIIFSGKAHPADEPGKLIIQQIYRAVKDAKTGGRMVFLENYDMDVARHLVQGVDVWMNTPRRPNEASGTSGMKAALNGVINFSVLDGWWYEGYNGSNGWAIGDGTEYGDYNQQDDADAESLYNVLEKEVVPLYYNDRTANDIPTKWIARMKESICTLSPQFSMQRMVREYMRRLYLPAMRVEKYQK